MDVIVGKRYRFKNDMGLTNDVDGKEFTVTSINNDRQLIFLKFDDKRETFNIDYDIWKMVVVTNKWEGSKIVFNFI